MRWSLLPAVFVTLAAADNVWSEVTATGGPAELEYPSAVWDEANKRMLTFGGGDNSDAFHDSVFSLEDSTWTDISTSGTGPAGRYRQAIALDGSRMFVFGGSSEDRHKDLFALDLTTYAWSSLDDGDELFGHSMLWDSQNSRLLVFGGQKGASEQYRDQLMEWKSAEDNWSDLSPSGDSPSKRSFHTAVWKSSTEMLVFGGQGGSTTYYKDLYLYDTASNEWSSLADGSAERAHHAAVFVGCMNVMLVHGGYDGSALSDLAVYTVSRNSWSTVETSGTGPSARFGHAAVWDSSRENLLVTGGTSATEIFSDTFRMTTSHCTTTTTSSFVSTTTFTATETTTSKTLTSSTISSSSSSQTSTTTASSITTSTSASSTTATTTFTVSTSLTITTTSSGTSTLSSTMTTSSTSLSSTRSTSRSDTTTTTATATTTTTTTTTTTATATTATTTATTTTTTTKSASSSSTSASATSSTSRTSVTVTASSRTESTTSSTTASSSVSSTRTNTATATDVAMPGSTSTASSATTTTSASTSQAISVTSSTAATSLANSVTSSLSTLTTTSGTSTSTLISTLTTSFATASSTNPPPLVDAVAARREEAAAASAAVEAAEERAVLQLLAALAPAPGAPPGVLGSAKVETEVGTVEVTAFSADAAAAAGGTVAVTGSGGVAVDVPSQVLGQAASIGGAGPVLLSFTSMSKVASKFQASAPNAPSPSGASTGRRLNALQSVPLSINLRGADGKKLDMSRLSSPMVLSVESFDPNATCAYWDEDQGMWSQSGVEKVGYEQGKLMCRTEHLSIFGALMESIFKDVAAVLKCSTAWQLVSVEGIKKIGEPGWTGYPPSIVTFCFLGGFLLAGSCAFRLDRRAEEAIPWLEREAMLLRSKKSVDRTKMRAFRPSVQEKGGRCSRCCRAVKNAFDYVVWLVGSSFGVENAAEVVSELVSNAPTATVSRCVAALHAHKSGACRESLKAVKDLAGPDLDKAARQASQREAAAGAAGGGAGGGGRRQVASRLRASVMNGVSVMMQNMDHFRVALQSMTQRWDVHGHGVWAVETFLSSGWCKRVAMLFPAVHPWVAITLFSMFTSHAVRAALIILKLSTSAASNALFFTSASSTPDSDAECAPPQTLFSRMVQGATVGVLSACLGDVIIFLLFMVQRRRVVEREEWTPEMKQKQVSRWWWRSCIFWSWWVFHESCCILYVFTFLANVTLADAVKWVESTGISLLQDLLLVPLAVSLVLGSLASLALRSARVRLAVEDKWIGSAPEENEEPAKELLRCRTFTGFAGVESEEGVNSEHGFSDVEADEEAEFSDSVSVDCSVRQDFCPVLPGVPT